MAGRPPEDPLSRWLRFVDKRGIADCWPWKGQRNKGGYGMFEISSKPNRKLTSAHRAGYQLMNSALDPKTHVCHTCDNPACCNPDHWFLGTHQDNMQDSVAKGRSVAPMRKKHRPHTRVRKLTDDQVRAIRKDPQHPVEIAYDYGIGVTTAFAIKNRKTKLGVPD